MRTRIEWLWEKLDESTFRAKIVGGWLVLHASGITIADGKKRETTYGESMTFVPDVEHRWCILPRQVETTVHKVKAADFASK